MTGNRPRASVLLTSYNHERFVTDALESVAAQTFADFELIVTDDCSDDGSAAVIRAWLDRTGFPATFIVNETNLGITTVRNNALRVARGRLVCSLAGDDFYEPDRLAVQVGAFEPCDDAVAVVYGDVRIVDEGGAVVEPSFLRRPGRPWPPPEGRVWSRLLADNFIPAPGVMMRRDAIDDVGGYDESLVYEDYDMWLRLADRFEFRYVDACVSNYRVVPSSLSRAPSRRRELAECDVRILLKWRGRSVESDVVVARRLWDVGWELAARDRTEGLRILRLAWETGLSGRRRWFRPLAYVPGMPRLVVAAYRWRGRRR